MPKENKKRGRRAELKKRKLSVSEHDESAEASFKRARQEEDNDRDASTTEADFISPRAGDQEVLAEEQQMQFNYPSDRPFYGLLDEEEQQFFHDAANQLNGIAFQDAESRESYLATLYDQSHGKELKLANSQSCSRVLEQMIQLSSPQQLKALFQKFAGNFIHLVTHRFASHCCEALFIHAAPPLSTELLGPTASSIDDNSSGLPPMEDYFLATVRELEDSLGFLMTDKYASHPLRILLLVLAGQPIAKDVGKSVLQSRKKESVTLMPGESFRDPSLSVERSVPASFHKALETVVQNCVSGLDTTYLRSLSTHQTGNPTLQLLLRLELTQFGKQRAKDESSIISVLLPDDPIAPESESASYINGLIYDPVGSRLLEVILEHAPGKTFKAIFRDFFKERLTSFARNDIASYVLCKALSRLSREDLQSAVDSIAPDIPSLVERNRLNVVRTLVDRCTVRGAETKEIAKQLESAYKGPGGFDISRLLKVRDAQSNAESSATSSSKSGISSASGPKEHKLQPSLLAQSMLKDPGPLSKLIFNALTNLPSQLLIRLTHDTQAAHVIVAALSSQNASLIDRRKIIAQFYGQVGSMALHPSASRVIDAVWTGTQGLAFIRERVAEELAENEAALRGSIVGKMVWRNWRMDMYKRRRRDWVQQSRNSAGVDAFAGFPEEPSPEEAGGRPSAKKHLSALEKARQRHIAEKARKESLAKDKAKRGSTIAVTAS